MRTICRGKEGLLCKGSKGGRVMAIIGGGNYCVGALMGGNGNNRGGDYCVGDLRRVGVMAIIGGRELLCRSSKGGW